jgi:ATP-dependent exoDNAse (exonuclease V) alpha subunit
MAVYFLNLKTFGRAGGSSAVSAAAYRAGERIRDERTGKTYDHSYRLDVMHKEILLPSRFDDQELAWARDRDSLWNTAEFAESRKNARVAREYLVALPVELSHPQRLDLVRGFSRELTDRYGFALDVAIHAPRDFPGSDPRNFHAHLLATTRDVTPDGLGAKTTLEMNDGDRRKLGMKPAVHELVYVRERWAAVTNEALLQAHIAARVDHRSLAAQGIDREPRPYIPRAAFEMERQGYRSVVADRMRAEYAARVEARLDRATRQETVAVAEATPAAEPAALARSSVAAPSRAAAVKPQSLDDIRREARENWLRMRERRLQGAEASSPVPAKRTERGHDDDLAH